MKRIIGIILTFSLLICCFSTSVLAKEIRANGFTVDDSTGYITDFIPAEYSGGNDVIVPNSINGIKIVGIADFAFQSTFDDLAGDDWILTEEEAAIRKIYIPNNITNLTDNAFYTGYVGTPMTVCCQENSFAYKYLVTDKGGMWWGTYVIKSSVPEVDLTGGIEVNTYVPEEIYVEQSIVVEVNGTAVQFDQQPIIENGRTLVPLRAIFEALGATVDWNGDTSTVTSNRNNVAISLTIGSNQLYVNGIAKTIDVPAQLVNGRTMVPARAIAEAFGCNVDWDDTTKTVIINE